MKIDCKEIVRKQLASLKAMGMGALRAKFEELYGFGTKCINQDTVRRRVAYRIQELHLGGLPAETEGELERLADGDPLARLENVAATRMRKSSGTKYVREWKGRRYEVIYREKGKYELDGVFYTSLSAAAFAITGTHWNGKLFFGVK